ncbi:MAG: biotin transporter BioY [Clostridia bacterium]|nr:biotin transporter BioY [Clostridia bacterium]
MSNPSRRMNTYALVLCALFAALTAVCAQITIPIGPVPISLSLLPVLLCAALMKKQYAALTMLVYMVMGLIGLPVFSNLTGGPGKLFGVTGGYIIGYLPCAFIASWMIEKLGRAYWKQLIAMLVGVAVCYVFGTVWFIITKGVTLSAALAMCVTPFLPGDAVKIALAAFLSDRLEKIMKTV